jgi:hypothetical protein
MAAGPSRTTRRQAGKDAQQRAQQVGTADDADHPAPIHHGQVFDIVRLHQLNVMASETFTLASTARPDWV